MLNITFNKMTKNNHHILKLKTALLSFVACIIFCVSQLAVAANFSDAQIQALQTEAKSLSVGDKIAFMAEQFIGTPYDRDPMGAYVTRKAIVADDVVDCMYLVFRTVELALSKTPADAINVSLNKRFMTRGVLDVNGKVANYQDRFQYGEDMVTSGKWGRNITAKIASTFAVPATTHAPSIRAISIADLLKNMRKLHNGDLVFWIKDPAHRSSVEAIIAHLSVIAVDKKSHEVDLIHAHGTKNTGGVVVKVPLAQYLDGTHFVGAVITRF